MKLVILESPGKTQHVQQYLGKDYLVMCSVGHIRDLATNGKGRLGVDVDNGFKPRYEVDPNKKDIIASLKKAVSAADEVILATDPDREGEAIAWHLTQVLDLDPITTKRVTFNEITKEEVTTKINQPTVIDMNLVASQETRRILDRIIGFGLSAWVQKYNHSESAGRVQSPALKLVCDQDELIDSFVSETYYVINVNGHINGRECKLIFDSYKNNKDKIIDEALAKSIIDTLPNELEVVKVVKSKKARKPIIPFETATLYTEASNRLKCSTDAVASMAQNLYQNGYITYIRTDYTALSPTFTGPAQAYIAEHYGKEYVGYIAKAKKDEFTQAAHEGIRPTSIYRTPESVKGELSTREYQLYELIYNHTLASLMKPKEEEILTITIRSGDSEFHSDFVRTSFDGYSVLNKSDNDYTPLPEISVGDHYVVTEKDYETKSTEPPAHYSEGALTALMKEKGIGRPSTYSPTIKTLKTRDYIKSEKGVLISTDKGRKTSAILSQYFPQYVDTQFTANMEDDLDHIGSKETTSIDVLQTHYDEFQETVTKANERAEKQPREAPKETGEFCELCGAPLVYRKNKKDGTTFVACMNYPKCKYTRSENSAESAQNNQNLKHCPKCDSGYLIRKKGAYGYFYACNNPECDYTQSLRSRKKSYYKK
ncbi:MAG: type I DNA topoisomerase [Coprobacillus sp.]|nr:type I DNA topoisomerase [Coprobacillus sp.]